jgi:hypothetical protein
LHKTQLEYDVLLVSNTGIGFSPGIEGVGPLGGTELECCLLLEELSKLGLKCGSVNPIGSPVKSKGVECWPLSSMKILDIKAKILINMRGVPPPTGIAFQRIIHWMTDLIVPSNQYYQEMLPPELKQTTVAVSDFHLAQMPQKWNPTRIYNMVPQFIYDFPSVKKDPRLFIYPSAAMKGLPETLKLWHEMRNHYVIGKSKLLVLSPGYDHPDMEELKKVKNVEFVGALRLQDVVGALARCTGLFSVNKMPETFGLVYAFAEAVGCAPHVMCLNGPGAIPEVINTKTVTFDAKTFSQNIIDYGSGKYQIQKPKNFSPSEVLSDWVRLLEAVSV